MRLAIAAVSLLGVTSLLAQTSIYESGGNVGIGGSPRPDAKLSVVSNAFNPTLLRFDAAGPAGGYYINFADVSIGGQGFGGAFLRWTRDNNYGRAFSVFTSDSSGLSAERFIVDSAGKVGIGTSSPSNRFHVQVNASDTGISLDDGGLNYNPVFVLSRTGVPRLSLSATSLVGTVSGRGGNGLALSGNNITQDVLIAPSGNVAIGGTGSTYRLSIDSAANSYTMRAHAAGDFILALAGDGLSGANVDLFSIRNNNTNVVHLNTVNGARMALGVSTSSAAGTIAENLTILSSGNVGIGTTNPTQKLSVNGTIRAKEVVVETSGWSDYVFAENYVLQPLAEVEAQIKQEKHLPGIPSAQQVAESGIGLGEMQAKLLSKIEELTLHMIELEKENQSLKKRVSSLETK